jgi:hypothetical protein
MRRQALCASAVLFLGLGLSAHGLPAQQPDDFKITSPADGALVRPGQTLDIQVSVAPGKASESMFILSPLGSATVSVNPPYRATLQVPQGVPQSRLIGRHNVTLVGRCPGKDVPVCANIFIDVEKEGLPLRLVADRNRVLFQNLGESAYSPRIVGYWADGSYFDLQESTYLRMRSSDPRLFSVDERGYMTALSPGEATLQVTYTLDSQQTSLSIPVRTPNQPLRALPSSFYFGMVQLGRASIALPVSLTNVSGVPQELRRIRLSEHFEETDNCAVPATLGPGESCTVTVTWHPQSLRETGGGVEIEVGMETKIGVSLTGSAVNHLP